MAVRGETEYEKLPFEKQAAVIKTIQRWQRAPKFGEWKTDALNELPFKIVLEGWLSLELDGIAKELDTPLYQRIAGQ